MACVRRVLRALPGALPLKGAKIHRGGPQRAAEKRAGFTVQGSGVAGRGFPEPRTPLTPAYVGPDVPAIKRLVCSRVSPLNKSN